MKKKLRLNFGTQRVLVKKVLVKSVQWNLRKQLITSINSVSFENFRSLSLSISVTHTRRSLRQHQIRAKIKQKCIVQIACYFLFFRLFTFYCAYRLGCIHCSSGTCSSIVISRATRNHVLFYNLTNLFKTTSCEFKLISVQSIIGFLYVLS